MNSVRIVNIAGLMMNGRDDSLEAALRSGISDVPVSTIAPTPKSSVFEDANSPVLRTIEMIRDVLSDIEKEDKDANLVLVGRSYGAFLALIASIRMQFENIAKVVLIEGPINPEIEVRPPRLIPVLQMCSNYYANREAIAREALSELDAESLSKIAIVQSSATDLIVPNSAQVLPVQSVIIDRAEDFDASLKLGSRENKSLVYRLPPDLTGRADGAKLLLPQAYRNHLFWSQEKMQSVVDFIRAIVRNAV